MAILEPMMHKRAKKYGNTNCHMPLSPHHQRIWSMVSNTWFWHVEGPSWEQQKAIYTLHLAYKRISGGFSVRAERHLFENKLNLYSIKLPSHETRNPSSN